MSKFQVPLNGSNFINKDRKQAFQDALEDQHLIDCQDQEQIQDTGSTARASDQVNIKDYVKPHNTAQEVDANTSPEKRAGLDQALDHTYSHQARTMEIHQQYLSHQAENIQLITAVLEQQGKVLDSSSVSPQGEIIETFQRTLDNFHSIREQSLSVHQEFLAQQADFSERYLSFLENNKQTVVKSSAAPDRKADTPSEWVVHVPPIVLDERTAKQQTKPAANTPAVPIREVNLPDPSGAPVISTEELSTALIAIVADKTGYPPEMLELNMDLEADLGIDSIKRVEILGALEDDYPSLPPADTEVLAQTRTLQEIVDYMNSETSAPANQNEPAAEASENQSKSPEIPSSQEAETSQPPKSTNGSAHTVAELTAILLEIVAEKTGYPVEMLEADMDMEADLGIDSIKRVEILGVMEERVPGLPAIEAETLAELRTLGQIADLMSASQQPADKKESVVQEEKKKVNSVELQNTPVNLRTLPAPDRLDFNIPSDHPLIVTNDGTSFTEQIVSELTGEGWSVVVWDFPDDLISANEQSFSKDVNRIAQGSNGKEAIDSALSNLRTAGSNPAGFIHLHPLSGTEGLFSDQERELIKQVFLIAGSLKSDLEQADPDSRNSFLTVTRTDGFLGTNNSESFQEGSGLTGLVKSLNWEWPEVFCRAIDLDREIAPEHAGKLILQEIHDPDRSLLEVGLSKSNRVTPIRENV